MKQEPRCIDCEDTGMTQDDDGEAVKCYECPPLEEPESPPARGSQEWRDGLADHRYEQWKERRLEAGL